MRRELAGELLAHARRHGTVPPARAGLDELAEVGDLRPAVGDRVVGEAVAEILEREAAARGDLAGRGDAPAGRSAKRRAISAGARRWRSAFGERRRPSASSGRPEPDGRQDVEDRALAGRRVTDAAGGDDGEPGLPRERHGAAGHELALARAVPLELHVDPVPAEARDEPLERRPRRRPGARPGDRGSAGRPRPPVRQRSPAPAPSRSASVARARPFGARAFTRVMRRQSARYPARDSTRSERRVPSASVRAAPTSGRTPAACAALWKRGAP